MVSPHAHKHRVVCDLCDLTGPYGTDEQEARQLWNTRAESDEGAEMVAELLMIPSKDADKVVVLTGEVERLKARIAELEDRLFRRREMEAAPCFVCGYNGPAYYQPGTHPCAERHHRLAEES